MFFFGNIKFNIIFIIVFNVVFDKVRVFRLRIVLLRFKINMELVIIRL